MDPKDIRIKPRCLTFQPKSYHKPAAYTADGFMLPCCWLDSHKEEVKELYDPTLTLNKNSIKEIINSN